MSWFTARETNRTASDREGGVREAGLPGDVAWAAMTARWRRSGGRAAIKKAGQYPGLA